MITEIESKKGLAHIPYAFSIDQTHWIPIIPTVNNGVLAHFGPLTLGVPTHCTACASGWLPVVNSSSS